MHNIPGEGWLGHGKEVGCLLGLKLIFGREELFFFFFLRRGCYCLKVHLFRVGDSHT